MARQEVEKLHRSQEKNEIYSEEGWELQETRLLVGSPWAALTLQLRRRHSGREGRLGPIFGAWGTLGAAPGVGTGKNIQAALENARKQALLKAGNARRVGKEKF